MSRHEVHGINTHTQTLQI